MEFSTETTAAPAASSPGSAEMSDSDLRALMVAADIERMAPASAEDIATLDKELGHTPPATPAAVPAGKDPESPPAEAAKKTDPAPAPVAATPEKTTPTNPTPEDEAETKEIEARLPKTFKPGSQEAKDWIDLRKGEARQAATWKKINDERPKLEQERKALAQEKEEIARLKQERENHLTAEDYLDAAERYTKQGDAASARLCQEQAAALRAGKADFIRQKFTEARREAETLETSRQRYAEQAAREVPELHDANSEATKLTAQIFHGIPRLQQIPEGPLLATRMAKATLEGRAATAKAEQLETQLAAERAETKRLRGLLGTTPNDGPGPRKEPKTPAEMSTAEFRAQLAALDRAENRV